MAEIVNTLFGLSPEQVQLKDEQKYQGLYGAFGAKGNVGGVLGVALAQGLNKVFPTKDPELEKAVKMQEIQKELRTSLSQEEMQNPSIYFPTLSKLLADSGYENEANQVTLMGNKEIEKYTDLLQKRELTGLQVEKAERDLMPVVEQLEQDKNQAALRGDVPLALRIEAEQNKLIPEVKKEPPQTIADRAILSSFQTQFGDVEGAKKYDEYQIDKAQAKKTSESKDDNGKRSITDIKTITDQVNKRIVPTVERISNINAMQVTLDQARAGNPDANNQLNRQITTLVGDKQIGVKEVQMAVSGGSLLRRTGNLISQYLSGKNVQLSYDDKQALINLFKTEAIKQNKAAVKNFKNVWGQTLTTEELDKYLSGVRYNSGGTSNTDEYEEIAPGVRKKKKKT